MIAGQERIQQSRKVFLCGNGARLRPVFFMIFDFVG